MATKHKAALENALKSGDNGVDAPPTDVAEDVKNVFEAMALEEIDGSLDEEDIPPESPPESEEEEEVPPAPEPTDKEDKVEPPPSSKKGEDLQPAAPPKPPEPPKPTAEEMRQREEEAATRRKQLATELEQKFSSMLTEEDRDALMTEPEKVLPRLLANASLQTLERFRETMGQELPQHLSRLTAEQKASQELENKFFERWPQLKGAEKAPTVERVVRAYMASAQAGITPDTAIEEAGAMAMVALRIPIQETQSAEPPAPVKRQTFTPAQPGGTVQRKVGTPPARNVFETLAEEFLEDDLS